MISTHGRIKLNTKNLGPVLGDYTRWSIRNQDLRVDGSLKKSRFDVLFAVDLKKYIAVQTNLLFRLTCRMIFKSTI